VRVVVLSSSIYSETACATAAGLAGAGYAPVGALCLRTLDYGTLLRKLGQWGVAEVARYAWGKLIASKTDAAVLHNPYLAPFLNHDGRQLNNLRQLASLHGFPLATCGNQNSNEAVAQLKKWAPDLIVFAGGNVLRRELLQAPRLGVVNVHLGLLPEIRGMSSPEWSLLKGVPLVVTIHYMDSGIDTGRILLRREFPELKQCDSLERLRNRLIALGIEELLAVIRNLDQGSISPYTQPQLDQDNQFFVIHERLRALAAERLVAARSARTCAEVA
jgi:methionyl-tRNA formyltransferase